MVKTEKEFTVGLRKNDEKTQYVKLWATGPRQARKKILTKLQIENKLGLYQIVSMKEESAEQVVMDLE